jgi:hypothetical protein
MKPIKCKFCRKDVMWNIGDCRVYEADGKTPHVNNCPRRKAHFHSEALTRAEAKRSAKSPTPHRT